MPDKTQKKLTQLRKYAEKHLTANHFAESAKLYEQMIEIYKANHLENSEDALAIQHNLNCANYDLGKKEEASQQTKMLLDKIAIHPKRENLASLENAVFFFYANTMISLSIKHQAQTNYALATELS